MFRARLGPGEVTPGYRPTAAVVETRTGAETHAGRAWLGDSPPEAAAAGRFEYDGLAHRELLFVLLGLCWRGAVSPDTVV